MNMRRPRAARRRAPLRHEAVASSAQTPPTTGSAAAETPEPRRLAIRDAEPTAEHAADRADRSSSGRTRSPTCASTSWPNSTNVAKITWPSMFRHPRVMRHRAQQRVAPQPAEPLGELLPATAGASARPAAAGSARRVADDAEHQPGRRRRTCRRRTGTAGRTRWPAAGWRAAGRRTGWRRSRPSTSARWPARGRRSSTTAGRNVWALLSWSTSHEPSSSVATSEHEVQEPLGADDRARPRRAPAATVPRTNTASATSTVSTKRLSVGADHQAPAVVAVGDHTGRQREQQPRQALDDGDEGDQQGVAGDRRRQPRIGDDARPRRRGWRSSSLRTACGSWPRGCAPDRRT